MPPQLPSFRFQPKFYTGGVSRFHLAFFYDLVATQKPRKIVTLGFSDSQIHFTWCQAMREYNVAGRCQTINRAGDPDDAEWQVAMAEAEEFYPDVSVLRTGDPTRMTAEETDGSIDILLIDDCDRGDVVQSELEAWRSKLAPQPVILLHGLNLERANPLRSIWQ